MEFTPDERIRANVCFERLSQGWDTEAAHELIILFKDKPSIYWSKDVDIPKRKNKDFMTGHTVEMGDVSISEDDTKFVEDEDENIERIGNYKVEFLVTEDRTVGIMRFRHFWASSIGTMSSGCPPPYFVMYINFKENSCVQFLRADYKKISIQWRYYWRYLYIKFFYQGYELTQYEPQLTVLYEKEGVSLPSSRLGRLRLILECWFYQGIDKALDSPIVNFFLSSIIGRFIFGTIYLVIIFKLIVWIGMWLFLIHPIIPLGLNGAVLIGGLKELKSAKEKRDHIFSVLFYSSTMTAFLIESYYYYFG